ncbi:MAG: hypothetical protein Q8P42_11305 [Gallionella sp.]|nr:hypothetical protein [Gallionella sp.]
MISKTQIVRYAFVAACVVLTADHAIASDNYIGIFTFTPPLTVNLSSAHSDLIVSTWGSEVQGTVRYFFNGNAGIRNEIVTFGQTAGEMISIGSEFEAFCYEPAIVLPPSPYLGLTATTMSLAPGCLVFVQWPGLPTYTFKVEGKPVTQMRASDGSSFDALPLVVTRDGKPWQTYYFGYKMGLAAKTFDYPVEATDPDYFFYESLKAADFKLAKLPPPTVEGTVVEYVNTADFPNSPGGHYFYSADVREQVGVDVGEVGAFKRTGRSFKAGGYVSVCRFYGSMSPGPNSHFFTADQGECDLLKSLQQTPIPGAAQQWNYEGQGFSANTPIPAVSGGAPTCPAGSAPVYRAYNNAWVANGKNPWDSNHRFSTDPDDIQEVVTKYGWQNEGIVMCAPN